VKASTEAEVTAEEAAKQAAKAAKKAAKKRELEDAAGKKRVSPRLAAAADAAAVPSLALEAAPVAKKPKKDKAEKAAKKDKAEKRPLEASEEPPKKKNKQAADQAEDDATVAKKKKTKEEKAAKKEKKEKKTEDAASAETAAVPAAAAGAKRVSPRLHAASAATAALPEISLGGAAGSSGTAAAAAPSTGELSAEAYRREHSITGSVALPDPVQSFASAPFDARLRATLSAAGYTSPSPIQAQAWPVAVGGSDLVAVAKTGSGKTVGFLLPAFSVAMPKLPLKQGQGPLALVMAPVRELAQQIQVEAERFGGAIGIKSVCVYGGAPKGPQIGALSRGRPVLVVGTPGRLNDLLSLANPPVTNLDSCIYLVLDEADRMLDMGFEPQIKQVIERLPTPHQTLFFTATWPREVKGMAASYLSPSAVQIFVGGSDAKLVANKAVTQKFEALTDGEKPAALQRVVEAAGPTAKIVIFCNTKANCERMLQEQRKLGRGTCAIHGDKEQWEREQALHQFMSGRTPIMFATDVAARGLDVKGVTLVVNYDMPQGDDGVESYVHRIGRTGRAGATGEAVSFWNAKTDRKQAAQLMQLLTDAEQEVPDFIASASGGGRGKGRGWGGKGGGKGRGGKGGGKGKGGGGKGGGGKGWKKW